MTQHENKYGVLSYEPSEGFAVGDPYTTGISGVLYGQNVTYKCEYVGFIHSTGAISNFQTFVTFDVEYGNVEGWGEYKVFDDQNEFEKYIEEHFDEIVELLEYTDFD